MPNSVLIDASFLVTLSNLADKNRAKALAFLQLNRDKRVIPEIVLAEAAHVIRYRIGQRAVLAFLDGLIQSEALLQPVSKADLQRAREIMAQYAASDFDLADCCIMALAERLQITQVCTFDQRDFRIFRPRHCPYLELLP